MGYQSVLYRQLLLRKQTFLTAMSRTHTILQPQRIMSALKLKSLTYRPPAQTLEMSRLHGFKVLGVSIAIAISSSNSKQTLEAQFSLPGKREV